MSILLEHCQDLYILNEAFYGKPKEFIEIEKRLEKIIEMVKLTKENPKEAVNINDMKQVYEIERLFTNFFGNNETSITFYAPIHGFSPGYNAYTVPTTLSYFKKDPNNKRIVRVKDLFINVNVGIDLIYALDLDSKELMAIILHEIGHCFDASLFQLLSHIIITGPGKYSYDGFDSLVHIPTSLYATFIRFILYTTPAISKFYQEMNRFISQNPTISKIMGDIDIALHDFKLFSLIINFSLKKINPIYYINKLISPTNIFGYAGEKFADSFASSYGYGKETVSIQYKVQQRKGLLINDITKKIPILNIGYDFLKISMQFSTILIDPHPQDAVRIQSQLNKLKRDLNDPNLSPKVKKELLENITDIENYIDNVVLNIDYEDNNGRWFTMFTNYLVIKIFNGKIDPRELFEAVWNHEM